MEMTDLYGVDVPDGTVIHRRQLNRALLARQYLLHRASTSAAETLDHLVGMQSQAPNDPYIALWTRLDDFYPDQLSRMMLDREAVRASLMRGTIHVVTSDDYLSLQPVLRALHERAFRGNALARTLDMRDVPGILEAAREMLAQEPMTAKALGARLGKQWPDRDPAGMAQAARFLLQLVQTTPRGVWRASHQATWALAESWIGRPLALSVDPGGVLLRYLAAFGPATVADMQTWSGLQGLRPVIDQLRPQLRVYRNERGQELFDVPGAPLPDGGIPVPVRFLPGFDNALLSHADRSRIVSEESRKAIGSQNGLFLATYLVDGFVAGTWSVEGRGERVMLKISPFEQHKADDLDALRDEGEKLLVFVAGVSGCRVEIGEVSRG